MGPAEIAESIFDVVNQLNRAVDLIDDPAERLSLLRLNVIAGMKAKAAIAYGKLRQIDQDYPLPHKERTVSSAATIETPVEQLDLGTVMKVSQAVSGEIVDQLVRTLMVIAVEHAGAERGLLILPYGEEYRIVAEAGTGRVEDKADVI